MRKAAALPGRYTYIMFTSQAGTVPKTIFGCTIDFISYEGGTYSAQKR